MKPPKRADRDGRVAHGCGARSLMRIHVSVTGVCISLLFAVFLPSIEAILGLMGATCSIALSFIIPALLYSRLVLARAADEAGPPHESPGIGGRLAVLSLISFGVITAIIAVPLQLSELFGTLFRHEAYDTGFDAIALKHHTTEPPPASSG